MNHFWRCLVQYELLVESITHGDGRKWWPSQKYPSWLNRQGQGSAVRDFWLGCTEWLHLCPQRGRWEVSEVSGGTQNNGGMGKKTADPAHSSLIRGLGLSYLVKAVCTAGILRLYQNLNISSLMLCFRLSVVLCISKLCHLLWFLFYALALTNLW